MPNPHVESVAWVLTLESSQNVAQFYRLCQLFWRQGHHEMLESVIRATRPFERCRTKFDDKVVSSVMEQSLAIKPLEMSNKGPFGGKAIRNVLV